jgi:hypothetical protein
MRIGKRLVALVVVLILAGFSACWGQTAGGAKLSFEVGETKNAKAIVTDEGKLRVVVKKKGAASVTLKAPEGGWDLTQFLYVTMEVRNSAAGGAVIVRGLIDNNGWVDGGTTVPAGETRTLSVLLKRNHPPEGIGAKLFGMNGLPGGYVWIWEPIDLGKVSSIQISFADAGKGETIEISEIHAEGIYEIGTWKEIPEGFFPFIDEFGQYAHADWPGRTKSAEDFVRYHKEEVEDLQRHPGPEGWNKYGGWEAGPKLKATGHFRVEKYEGKWWLVDPEGRLFWSHGITCVRSQDTTAISDREHYFKALPAKDSPLAKFYGTGQRAAHGYYKTHTPFKTYDFSQANLLWKWGENWEEKFSDITHRRLRSWGMNTIANWSDEAIYLQRKAAYTATLGTGGGSAIEGTEGTWRKFPDPFDDGFRKGLAEQLEKEKEKGKSAEDPWCIGYFVDNELTWENDTYLAGGVVTSEAEQPAKKAMLEDLKGRYKEIEKLNSAWGTKYESWEKFLEDRERPASKKAEADLRRFNIRLADKYFGTIRDVIKKYAPEKLYLGCRFDFHFYPEAQKEREWVIGVAAKYCDVVSFNQYRYTVGTLAPPKGIDKPLIVGEWHMGALDRGMFHTGLRSVANQAERAEAYKNYVRGALENPYVVGVHWFQYKDQPTTGRGDGENYQIGFVNICDTPYQETVDASREVGYGLYEYRMGK